MQVDLNLVLRFLRLDIAKLQLHVSQAWEYTRI